MLESKPDNQTQNGTTLWEILKASNDKGVSGEIKIDFDKLVQNLKDDASSDISMLWFQLEAIWVDLNDKNSVEVQNIIKRLSSVDNYTEIELYLNKLELIAKKHWVDKEETTNTSIDKEEGLLDSVLSNTKWFFLDSKSLNKIQAINIDGKVDDMQEFQNKLDKFILVIKNDTKFQKLSPEKQNKILEGLSKLWKGLEKQQNKTLDFLDNKINGLAEQIETQDKEPIQLTIEWSKVSFSSKKEAFEFVYMLKIDAEDSFQSLMLDIEEALGASLLAVFSSDTLVFPYLLVKNSVRDGIENYQDNEWWASHVIDTLQILFFSVLAVNYTESIYRRLVRDSLGKMWFKKYQIWDFSRNRAIFQSWESADETNNKERYNRRLDALDYLKNNLSQISAQNRSAYLSEIKNIESYLNIDSKTFWLKFEALRNDRWLIWRSMSAFKYGSKFTPFDINRTQPDFVNANKDVPLEEIKKGLQYVFDEVSVNHPEWWNREINAWNESKVIKDIRLYIDSLWDSERRKSTSEALDKFLDSLKVEPLSQDEIKSQLFNIVENNYLYKGAIISQINKKYFPELDVESLERAWFFKWFLQAYDTSKWKISEINTAIVEMWGKNAPASLTSGQALAIRWREAVKSWRWEWTPEEVKMMFDQIDSGKKNISFGTPFSYLKNSVFWKYGIDLSFEDGMDKFGDLVKNKPFNEILEKGREFSEQIEKAKQILSGEISENLTHIFDFDGDRFPPEKEKKFEKMFADFKEAVESWKLKLTPDQMKLELVKMYEWYLTSQKILLEIEHSFNKKELKSEAVRSFIQMIETGRWIGTWEDLKLAIADLKLWNTILEKIPSFDLDIKIEKIIAEWKKHAELDFSNGRFGIFESDGKISLDSYRNSEWELARLIKTLSGVSNNSDTLGQLFHMINQDNINYKAPHFLEELNKALDLSFSIDENTTRADYQKQMVSEIEPRLQSIVSDFESKTLQEKELIIEKLKNVLWISISELESNTTKALKNVWFNIGFYTDKIVDFHQAKEILKSQEQQKKQLEENKKSIIDAEKREKIAWIQSKIDYLFGINLPDTLDWINDAQSDFRNRDIFISLEQPSQIIWAGKDFMKRNHDIVQLEIQRLETEILKLQSPAKYFYNVLDTLERDLKWLWHDTAILDAEFAKFTTGVDMQKLVENWEIDRIFIEIETMYTRAFSESWIDTKVAKGIIESIRKNGIKITR